MAFFVIRAAGVTTLTCDRQSTQVHCIKSQSRFFGLTQDADVVIEPLTGVQVDRETRTDDDGDPYPVHRVMLLSHPVVIPLTDYSTRGAEVRRQANQIQTFLQSSQASLILQHDSRWKSDVLITTAFTVVFQAIGAAVLSAVLRTKTVIFDKTLNQYTQTIQTLWGTRVKTDPLDQIERVDLEEEDSAGDRSYRPVLRLRDGQPLTFNYTQNEQEAKHWVQVMRDFLRR
jgi:hypothetical protein